MSRPLPDGLTIKNSPIEGLGLFATIIIKKNTFIGVTHIRATRADMAIRIIGKIWYDFFNRTNI